jgi:hypothetical protein
MSDANLTDTLSPEMASADPTPDALSRLPPQQLRQGTPQATLQETRRYEVCFFRNRRVLLHWLDRDITLGPEGIGFAIDGATSEERLSAIVAVHLKTTGAKSNVESCTITFADGSTLTALNCNAGGYRDTAFAAAYRDFVHDLHARLAAQAAGAIRFTEGWSLVRCQAMMALAFATALVSAGLGLWTFYCLGDLKGLGLALLGSYGAWRFYRVTLNNLPRDYTPDRLPEFLLS